MLLSSEDSAPLPLANLSGMQLVGAMPHFVSPRELRFDAFRELPRGVHYWVLPASFTGDKVTQLLRGHFCASLCPHRPVWGPGGLEPY